MKVIFVIIDGLGDRPIKELGHRTPLEAASKQNMSILASKGVCGMVDVIGVGIRPGSDTAHLALFGYDPKIYYNGRGIFEVCGIGMRLKRGDVALRVNLATVDQNLKIIDRRAGRITSVAELVKDLNGMVIDKVKFFIKAGTAHRAGLILRGKNLSSNISDSDPHVTGVKVKEVLPLDNSKEAKFTARVLNRFLLKAHEILKSSKVNKERVKKGLLPANYLLTRGASSMEKIPSFKNKWGLRACCIAGAGLYKGIAKVLDMDLIEVKGATGMPNTNIKAKMAAAKEAIKKYDFVWVHIKAADNLAEDGNFKEKKKFIERIDHALEILLDLNILVVITADHSTPCELKAHSGDPVPILISGRGIRIDGVKEFGERECAENGGLGRIKGLDLLPEIINLIGKAKLYGA